MTDKPIISLIAALTRNRVIGRNNDLPWKLPDDMKYFMETTKGHPVIMGRKNFDSLPPKFKPLKDRLNIVMTRNAGVPISGVEVASSMEAALAVAERNLPSDREIFVIGGAQIYQQAMAHADRLYLTEIDAELDGDTWFPSVSKGEWREVYRKHHAADERHAWAFDFVIYERVR